MHAPLVVRVVVPRARVKVVAGARAEEAAEEGVERPGEGVTLGFGLSGRLMSGGLVRRGGRQTAGSRQQAGRQQALGFGGGAVVRPPSPAVDLRGEEEPRRDVRHHFCFRRGMVVGFCRCGVPLGGTNAPPSPTRTHLRGGSCRPP